MRNYIDLRKLGLNKGHFSGHLSRGDEFKPKNINNSSFIFPVAVIVFAHYAPEFSLFGGKFYEDVAALKVYVGDFFKGLAVFGGFEDDRARKLPMSSERKRECVRLVRLVKFEHEAERFKFCLVGFRGEILPAPICDGLEWDCFRGRRRDAF